jgi:hypothetical protein
MLLRTYQLVYLLHIELFSMSVLRVILISKVKSTTKNRVTVALTVCAGILLCWKSRVYWGVRE